MKKEKFFKILSSVIVVLIIAFIFSNSILSRENSAESSGNILRILNSIVKFLGIPFEFSHNFVRKCAHFTEFFALGASLFGLICAFKKPSSSNMITCSFAACLVAMTDETIQLVTDRGSMLIDVWLDFSSAALALLILYFAWKIKKRKGENNGKTDRIL